MTKKCYIYAAYKWPTTAVTVVYNGGTLTQTFASALAQGMRRWNDTGLVTISIDASSKNTMCVDSYTESWYGLTTKTLNSSTGNISKFEIKINSRTLSNAYASQLLTASISTVAHEFGHVFGLADIEDASNPNYTLMNHYRDRLTVNKPTDTDIAHVKSLYGL